jgi:hypothetical protein
MKNPSMVKEKERIPPYYPVYEDLATPLGLVNVIEPDAQITRLVAKSQTSAQDKDNTFEQETLDGYAWFESSHYHGSKGNLVLNCLNKSAKRIEQTYRVRDLVEAFKDTKFPELVIKHVDYLRPAAKDCDICNSSGIDSLMISQENKDPGRTWSANGRSTSHAQYLIDRMIENDRLGIYPLANVKKYVKGVSQVVAIKGWDGQKLIPSNSFLPEPFAQNAVKTIMVPWAKDRWWTAIREPSIKCAPAYQDILRDNYRGRGVA